MRVNDLSKNNKLKDRLIEYFLGGVKKPDSGTLGLELEHFIVDAKNLTSLSYYGENSVEEVLKSIAKHYAEPIYSEGHLIGLKRDKCLITLEPAAQIETSIGEFKNVSDFENEYNRFRSQIMPILNNMNARLVSTGYQPKSKIDSLLLIPKKRYALMDKHFQNSGLLGKNMMKGTASTQVSIDYFSEDDFKVKFFVSNVLTPFFAYFFDNSPIFEGEVASTLSRVKVWQNVDNARCGLLKCAFDNTGFEGYADYIAASAPIFLLDAKGEILPTAQKSNALLFEDKIISKAEIEHILSMVFPFVRLKTYIEIRMPDSLPLKYALGFLALIKGIFYHKESLNFIYDLLGKVDYSTAVNAFETLKNDNTLYSYDADNFFELLFDLAYKGLEKEEQGYLVALKDLTKTKRPLDLENILNGGDS